MKNTKSTRAVRDRSINEKVGENNEYAELIEQILNEAANPTAKQAASLKAFEDQEWKATKGRIIEALLRSEEPMDSHACINTILDTAPKALRVDVADKRYEIDKFMCFVYDSLKEEAERWN